jgi:hypothetical protein
VNKRIRKKRLRQLLLAELSARFDSEDEAIAWLDTALPELDGRTPRTAVAADELERVVLLLDAANRSAR